VRKCSLLAVACSFELTCRILHCCVCGFNFKIIFGLSERMEFPLISVVQEILVFIEGRVGVVGVVTKLPARSGSVNARASE
jgi:hypothetical protein